MQRVHSIEHAMNVEKRSDEEFDEPLLFTGPELVDVFDDTDITDADAAWLCAAMTESALIGCP
eukprot:2206279-Prorocentrum_lima.AAC.1